MARLAEAQARCNWPTENPAPGLQAQANKNIESLIVDLIHEKQESTRGEQA